MAAAKGAIATALLAAAALAGGWVLLSPDKRPVVTDATLSPIGDGEAAVFLSIDNRGGPDRLIAVSSPAGKASLYTPQPGSGLTVPGEDTALLAADGAHIRLADSAKFAEGELIPLTLEFEQAGLLTAKARMAGPVSKGAAGEAGLFGLGDICRVGADEDAPEIALDVRPDGEGWLVKVRSENFRFSQDLAGLGHIPGTGHGHLYVDGVKLGRLYSNEAPIGALPPGRHEVRVTLNTNDHRAYVADDIPVSAIAEILVE